MKRRNFIGYLLLFLSGCTLASCNGDRPNLEAVNAPEKLRFAVTDVIGREKLEENYEPFRQQLAEVLGIPVEFFPVQNMNAAASALQLNQVDFVLTGPSEYVAIRARTNAVPVIAITRPNYRSVLAVAANSDIKSVADLKGKSIALSDVGSTSGHLGPTKLLIDAQLNPKSDVNVKMLGDEGSVAAMKNGEVDAWGGSAIDYKVFFKEEATSPDRWRILKQGPPLPSDIFVASSLLEPAFVAMIRSQLVDNQESLIQTLTIGEATQKYKGSQLVPADDKDYDPIREVYQAIGEGTFIP